MANLSRFADIQEDKMKIGHPIVLAAFLIGMVTQPSFGADENKVVGTWKLRAYVVEVQATGRSRPLAVR